ncbi:dioxygenase, partial [Streptomyces sp. NEAU-H3]|nr:dioxygenase [Streptomyces sp. NEAU-H3]
MPMSALVPTPAPPSGPAPAPSTGLRRRTFVAGTLVAGAVTAAGGTARA